MIEWIENKCFNRVTSAIYRARALKLFFWFLSFDFLPPFPPPLASGLRFPPPLQRPSPPLLSEFSPFRSRLVPSPRSGPHLTPSSFILPCSINFLHAHSESNNKRFFMQIELCLCNRFFSMACDADGLHGSQIWNFKLNQLVRNVFFHGRT